MSIDNFITQRETAYKLPVPITDNWDWNMRNHINLTILYKNSQYSTEQDDKPFKNIIRPLLNLQYRAEGFDIKDIILFVDDVGNFFKSFLIRKFHEKWARSNNMDTFIDDIVESYVDFGGVLVKKTKHGPEVVPLQSIAFCDQTDILSGPIGIRHQFSPDQLKKQEKVGWGNEANGATTTIDKIITLSEGTKTTDDGKQISTPGKYIEVYEIHGTMPGEFLKKDSKVYISQMQIVALYQDTNGKKQYQTLYAKEEKESPFKFLVRDKIFNRTLGLGGAEELFDPQVWTNYDIIRMKDMLDAASKVILTTTDSGLAARHPSGLKSMNNLEFLEVADGKDVGQLDTFPRNLTLFERSVDGWKDQAMLMSGATDAILGESPSSGTPFKLQELVVAESHSLHDYRKGKIATFVDEIYRDWNIPDIVSEINKGQEFLAELDLKEMQVISENIINNQVNAIVKERILSGNIVFPEEINLLKIEASDLFMKDNKKFLKILKDELKNTPIDVKTNIAGKQKNLPETVQKLTNIFRQVIANPTVLQSPPMADLFNQILEYSGLEPINLSGLSLPITTTGKTPIETPKIKESPIPAGLT